MKKIVFTIALLAILSAASFASTSKGGPNYKDQSFVKKNKNIHHAHIVVPMNHYNM